MEAAVGLVGRGCAGLERDRRVVMGVRGGIDGGFVRWRCRARGERRGRGERGFGSAALFGRGGGFVGGVGARVGGGLFVGGVGLAWFARSTRESEDRAGGFARGFGWCVRVDRDGVRSLDGFGAQHGGDDAFAEGRDALDGGGGFFEACVVLDKVGELDDADVVVVGDAADALGWVDEADEEVVERVAAESLRWRRW